MLKVCVGLPKHISLFFDESVHDEFVIDRSVDIFVLAFLAFHITSRVGDVKS